MNQETILVSVKNVKLDCYVEPLIVYRAIFSLCVLDCLIWVVVQLSHSSSGTIGTRVIK